MEAARGAIERNRAAISALCDTASLADYSYLTKKSEHGTVWTRALQTALNSHEVVVIPPSDEIYWIDSTVTIPSNTRIEATGATIRVVPVYNYVMLRNENAKDGTFAPIDPSEKDENISIHGGRWDEGATGRSVRRYHAAQDSFMGVRTCMLFSNVKGLTLNDVTFVCATSFCVQIGNVTDGVFENFSFISCFADGLHVNGNCENLYVNNFTGYVGDDLVALNMYDWLGSSINYGPARNIFCENIHSSPDSEAKAMRLQPGIFAYPDGVTVDCSINDIYIRNVSGIFEYKLYFQSPPYCLGAKPEGEGAGSCNNLFFENIDIVSERLYYPKESDVFGMFFINSNAGYISLDRINYTVRENELPTTYLVAIGPMSYRVKRKTGEEVEVFDPYISSRVDTLCLSNVTLNGKPCRDARALVKTIEFDDVNCDGFSSGRGEVKEIYIDGNKVK